MTPSNCDSNSGVVQGAACVCVCACACTSPSCVCHCVACGMLWRCRFVESCSRQRDEARARPLTLSVWQLCACGLPPTLLTCSTDEWGSCHRAQLAWVASLQLGPPPCLSVAVREWSRCGLPCVCLLLRAVRAGGGAGAARGLFSSESWLCVFLRVCLLRVFVHGSRRISCTCLE